MKNRRAFSDLIFVIIIVFLAFASFISYKRITKQNEASGFVAHANLVRLKLGETLNSLRRAEKKEQDSIRVNNEEFKNQILRDSLMSYQLLSELDSLTYGDKGQHAKILQLNLIIKKWLENLHRERIRSDKISEDLSDYKTEGQSILNRMQILFAEMRRDQNDQLLLKIQEKDRSAFLVPLYSLVFSFMAILLISGTYFRLRSETRLRLQAEGGQAIIHNFFQQAPAMLAILKGPDHVFEFANQQVQDLIGGRNPVNMSVREAVPESMGQGYFEILDEVYKTGEPFIGKEMPLQVERRESVQQIYINIICQVLKNASGETEGILVFCYDVSEQVLARNMLQETESRSRLAIEAARMGTFDWDLQNEHFLSSERLVEIFGYQNAQNTTHQNLLDRFHPEDKPIRDEAVQNSFKTGSLNYEARLIWPDESIHWINVIGKILSDNARNILRMYGTVEDITPQKIALEEKKHFVQELEKKVFERTQSLNYANFILKQTVSELEQTNSELASFNYIASHDLKEPIRKIKAFSKRIEDLDQEKLSESSKDYFQRIISAADRMENLIDAFLSYSQTSNIRAAFELTDFNKVFLEVKTDFAETIEHKNIRLESQPLPALMCIPLQINQLFTNLIANSIKYSRTDVRSAIEISAEELDGKVLSFEGADTNSFYWKINIRDNGIGFDQMYENQIFVLFQRLHNRQEYPGTGIGLAICKKIMRNHKGFISASGNIGSGAIFSMYFPSLFEV
jgi:PAS domain S-box-containing protein